MSFRKRALRAAWVGWAVSCLLGLGGALACDTFVLAPAPEAAGAPGLDAAGGSGGVLAEPSPDPCDSCFDLGQRCNVLRATDICVGCIADSECSSGVCIANLCVPNRECTQVQECGSDERVFCDKDNTKECVECYQPNDCQWRGEGHRCVDNHCILPCTAPAECASNLCQGGACVDCVTDTDCAEGAQCLDDLCLREASPL